MSPATLVPITPAVLLWAMTEAGIGREELAARTKVPVEAVDAWIAGDAQPSKTEFSQIVATVRRPSALFFLPSAPPAEAGSVAFRGPVGGQRHDLRSDELRDLTEARRFQDIAHWLVDGAEPWLPPKLQFRLAEAPAEAGQHLRNWLGIAAHHQLRWESSGVAFETWRRALQDRGILILLYVLHQDGIRAFALPDSLAPAIGLNTAFGLEARTFSLMHELGHLVTGSASACIGFTRPDDGADDAERWCESFAAEVLVPAAALHNFLEVRPAIKLTTLRNAREAVGTLGRAFKVSQRAMALRLIHMGLADQGLYALIDREAKVLDFPSHSGGGGMARPQLRLQRIGRRLPAQLLAAADQGRITYRDALDYLRLGTSELPELERLLAASAR